MNKIFFLHIPKTGGSSINAVFANQFDDGCYQEHIENLNLDEIDKILNKDNFFMSGHVPYPRIKNLLEKIIDIKRIVILRDPFDHLISHISWIYNLYSDIARFEQHPVEVQDLSAFLNGIDFNSLDDLQHFVETLSPYGIASFDNRQTRYLSDPSDAKWVTEKDYLKGLNNIKDFDFVGFFENLPSDVLKLVQCILQKSIKVPHINKKNKKVFSITHQQDEIKELLFPLLKYDLSLYKTYNKMNGVFLQ